MFLTSGLGAPFPSPLNSCLQKPGVTSALWYPADCRLQVSKNTLSGSDTAEPNESARVSQRFRTGRQTPLIHIEKFRYSTGIYSRSQCFNVIRNCRDRLRQSRRYGSFSCSECDADFVISSETTLFQFRFRKISFFISREPASSSSPGTRPALFRFRSERKISKAFP